MARKKRRRDKRRSRVRSGGRQRSSFVSRTDKFLLHPRTRESVRRRARKKDIRDRLSPERRRQIRRAVRDDFRRNDPFYQRLYGKTVGRLNFTASLMAAEGIIHREEVCRRRKERRESLFANDHAGSGTSGPKLRKRIIDSFIKC